MAWHDRITHAAALFLDNQIFIRVFWLLWMLSFLVGVVRLREEFVSVFISMFAFVIGILLAPVWIAARLPFIRIPVLRYLVGVRYPSCTKCYWADTNGKIWEPYEKITSASRLAEDIVPVIATTESGVILKFLQTSLRYSLIIVPVVNGLRIVAAIVTSLLALVLYVVDKCCYGMCWYVGKLMPILRCSTLYQPVFSRKGDGNPKRISFIAECRTRLSSPEQHPNEYGDRICSQCNPQTEDKQKSSQPSNPNTNAVLAKLYTLPGSLIILLLTMCVCVVVAIYWTGLTSAIALLLGWIITFEVFFVWGQNEDDRKVRRKGVEGLPLRGVEQELRYHALAALMIFIVVICPLSLEAIQIHFDLYRLPSTLQAGTWSSYSAWFVYVRNLILNVFDMEFIQDVFGWSRPTISARDLRWFDAKIGDWVAFGFLVAIGFLAVDGIKTSLGIRRSIAELLEDLESVPTPTESNAIKMNLLGQADRVREELYKRIERLIESDSASIAKVTVDALGKLVDCSPRNTDAQASLECLKRYLIQRYNQSSIPEPQRKLFDSLCICLVKAVKQSKSMHLSQRSSGRCSPDSLLIVVQHALSASLYASSPEMMCRTLRTANELWPELKKGTQHLKERLVETMRRETGSPRSICKADQTVRNCFYQLCVKLKIEIGTERFVQQLHRAEKKKDEESYSDLKNLLHVEIGQDGQIRPDQHANTLGHWRSDGIELIQPVCRLLQHPNSNVRLRAVIGLGRLCNPSMDGDDGTTIDPEETNRVIKEKMRIGSLIKAIEKEYFKRQESHDIITEAARSLKLIYESSEIATPLTIHELPSSYPIALLRLLQSDKAPTDEWNHHHNEMIREKVAETLPRLFGTNTEDDDQLSEEIFVSLSRLAMDTTDGTDVRVLSVEVLTNWKYWDAVRQIVSSTTRDAIAERVLDCILELLERTNNLLSSQDRRAVESLVRLISANPEFTVTPKLKTIQSLLDLNDEE